MPIPHTTRMTTRSHTSEPREDRRGTAEVEETQPTTQTLQEVLETTPGYGETPEDVDLGELERKERAKQQEMAQLEAQLRSLREHETQLRIRERIAALEAQEQRAAEKRREIELIAMGELELFPSVTETMRGRKRTADPEQNDNRPVSRPRTIREELTPLAQRTYTVKAPKTRDLTQYYGRSFKEARFFFESAELKWRADRGITWSTDEEKIDYCVQYFDSMPRGIWLLYEKSAGRGRTAWEKFRKYMTDATLDEDNRRLAVERELEAAKQRSNQSVMQFVLYLDELEDELGITDGETRRQRLYGKMLPKLQGEVARYHDLPRTREDLIRVATRLENLDRAYSEATSTSDPREGSGNQEKGKNRENPRDYRRQREERKGVASTPDDKKLGTWQPTCYSCGRRGHISRDCRSRSNSTRGPLPPRDMKEEALQASTGTQGRGPVICYNCQKPGHISTACTEPRRTRFAVPTPGVGQGNAST